MIRQPGGRHMLALIIENLTPIKLWARNATCFTAVCCESIDTLTWEAHCDDW
jgi:hypothetical protein